MGDFNGDGKSDLVAADLPATQRSCCLATATERFRPSSPFGAAHEPWSVTVGDFNGDGKSDLVTADYGGNTASVLLGNGNGTFQAKHGHSAREAGLSQLSVGDFNGDGKSDLVTADYDSNKASVLLGNGNGTFQAKQDFGTGSVPGVCCCGRLQRRRQE